MRQLTQAEIETLATGKGVRGIAVRNFLGTMGTGDARDAAINAHYDAQSYGWNAATHNALKKGIKLANGGTMPCYD